MANTTLKTAYSKNHALENSDSFRLNSRLFNTYNRISERIFGVALSGGNLDLGSGDKGFSAICETRGITSFAKDYPETDLESGTLDIADSSIDFVTMNAVIEHIANPENVLNESFRVLKPGGIIFVRTPNWQRDARDFYNDPTHVKPYTPVSMKQTLELHGFTVPFLEPGLVEQPWFLWQLPNRIKWHVAQHLPGGTKSILAVGQKPDLKT